MKLIRLNKINDKKFDKWNWFDEIDKMKFTAEGSICVFLPLVGYKIWCRSSKSTFVNFADFFACTQWSRECRSHFCLLYRDFVAIKVTVWKHPRLGYFLITTWSAVDNNTWPDRIHAYIHLPSSSHWYRRLNLPGIRQSASFMTFQCISGHHWASGLDVG